MPTTKQPLIRIARLVAMMRENRYPNFPKLLKEMQKLDAAGTFKLSQKTLQRDVDYLRDEYNAPIKYDYAKKGYYLTNSEWTWECPLLEPEEMKASLLGARLAETILPEPLQGAIRKAVDRQLMNNEKGMDDDVSLESLVGTISNKSHIDSDVFGVVFSAWEQHHTLKVDYTKIGYDEVKNFTIEPHVLTVFEGCWYIKGRMIAKGDWDCEEWGYPDMLLSVSRIKKAELLDTFFETDQRIVKEVANGNLFNMEEVYNASLRVTGISACYVKEQFPSKNITIENDGALILHIPAAIKLTLVKWILGEGGNVIVITPHSLAEDVQQQAQNLAEKQLTKI
jgi:predicted DNA-binding transcriptional regulator YafY